MTDGYWGSDLWEEQCHSAVDSYGSDIFMSEDRKVVVVNAHSNTMTRYTIVATRIDPEMGIGGKAIVSVLHPWGTAYPCDMAGLDVGYVVSKWRPKDRSYDEIHGGDAACVTAAIDEAMRMIEATGSVHAD